MSYKLHLGDCLDVMAGMAESSVDIILTDPPYYKVKDEPWDRQWETPQGFLDWLDLVLAQCQRLLRPNGSLYLFASPQMAARVEVLIGGRFNVLNHVTWAKGGEDAKSGGLWARANKESLRGFFPQTERIIFAEQYGADNSAKGEAGYVQACDQLRGFIFEPLRAYLDGERERAGVSIRQVAERFQEKTGSRTVTGMAGHWFTDVQWALPTEDNYEWLRQTLANLNHGGQYLRRDYEDLRRDYEDLRRDYEDLRRDYEDLRRPFSVTADVPYTDVWSFKTVSWYPGKHPTEKPQDLLRHMLQTSTRPGGVVLDPFMGKGSTGVAALGMERGLHFIGIEQHPGYFRDAAHKIAQAADPLPLFNPAYLAEVERERRVDTGPDIRPDTLPLFEEATA